MVSRWPGPRCAADHTGCRPDGRPPCEALTQLADVARKAPDPGAGFPVVEGPPRAHASNWSGCRVHVRDLASTTVPCVRAAHRAPPTIRHWSPGALYTRHRGQLLPPRL